MIRKAFSSQAIGALRNEILGIYESQSPDGRAYFNDDHFRYEMFNKSARAQRIAGRREILDVIEPLLGEDCHIIANTCWKNPPSAADRYGGEWHLDGGPHVPRPDGISWPEKIPYPVFAIGCHIFLEDCPLACGPTGVIPGSHKSGRPPPYRQRRNESLTWKKVGVKALTARVGDVLLFSSDIWHRRLPAKKSNSGRFFLQIHYARRDIAQRVKTTEEVNHVGEDASSRARSRREKLLLGLHPRGFYDG